jgi:hypothetical protein
MSFLSNKRIGLTINRTLINILIGFFFLCLTSCEQKSANYATYFSFDSLLQSQVELLRMNHASVVKTAALKGQESTEQLTPDSAGWVREFEVFSSLEVMNKPVYRGLYREEILDRGTEKIIRYETPERELPVQKLILIYNGMLLHKIEASFTESNAMYNASRYLELQFENLDGKASVSRYSIIGGQKMFLADSVNYAVTGNIRYSK